MRENFLINVGLLGIYNLLIGAIVGNALVGVFLALTYSLLQVAEELSIDNTGKILSNIEGASLVVGLLTLLINLII